VITEIEKLDYAQKEVRVKIYWFCREEVVSNEQKILYAGKKEVIINKEKFDFAERKELLPD
jgi:hypothetical protein